MRMSDWSSDVCSSDLLARLIPDVNSAESRPSTTRSAPTTLEAMCGYSNKKRRPESRPVRQWLSVRSAFQLHLRGERWIAVGIVRIEFCRRCFCGDSWRSEARRGGDECVRTWLSRG